jgi:hypothetical protein
MAWKPGSDSQADSNSVGHRQPLADVGGRRLLALILRGRCRTLPDGRDAVFKPTGGRSRGIRALVVQQRGWQTALFGGAERHCANTNLSI